MDTRDKVREQIAEILASFKQDRACMYPEGSADCDGGWFCLKNCLVLQDYLNKILSLVAIVDREADRKIYLQDIHYPDITYQPYVEIPEGWVKEGLAQKGGERKDGEDNLAS